MRQNLVFVKHARSTALKAESVYLEHRNRYRMDCSSADFHHPAFPMCLKLSLEGLPLGGLSMFSLQGPFKLAPLLRCQQDQRMPLMVWFSPVIGIPGLRLYKIYYTLQNLCHQMAMTFSHYCLGLDLTQQSGSETHYIPFPSL